MLQKFFCERNIGKETQHSVSKARSQDVCSASLFSWCRYNVVGVWNNLRNRKQVGMTDRNAAMTPRHSGMQCCKCAV